MLKCEKGVNEKNYVSELKIDVKLWLQLAFVNNSPTEDIS